MQYCRIISLDNNNSVKYTSSRKDNSTTNDSMVMKIAHATLYVHKHYLYVSEQYVQNSAEKSSGQNCVHGQTDGQTAMAIPVYPPRLCRGGV